MGSDIFARWVRVVFAPRTISVGDGRKGAGRDFFIISANSYVNDPRLIELPAENKRVNNRL